MPNFTIVTGAAGFIGRNCVAELNRRGNTDLILTDLLGTDEKWQNLLGLRFEDLIGPDRLLEKIDTLGKVDAIVHLGACSATTERDADYLLENNYRYTRTLAEWSLKNGARFVYASSGATYGDGSLGYNDADTVTPTLKPLNMYGYSKHLFDLWALKHDLFKQGIVGLKYFNVFGPYEDHKGDMRSVVNKAYQQIQKTGEVTLFKSDRPDYRDGEQMRDFVYVKDAVDVTLWFAENKAAPGGLYNCGTAQARTWVDLANATFAAMGRRPNIRFIDMPDTLKGKYQYFTQADATKLKAAGYARPFRSLEDAVKDYVDTYLKPTFGA
ncbi:MAG TPA: ADP-glyceromanno-heptose 6-epimerase [Tepidisphaeraceae bacterium]|jgi:ADP-L-glycero-D-manno-heptose 6-epimerase